MDGLSFIKITKENLKFFKPLFFDLSPDMENILLGAVYNGCACGASEISLNDYFASIEHFYIAEEYRQKGVGTAFMEYIIHGLSGCVYEIHTVYASDEECAHDFIGSLGFIRAKRADAYMVPFSTPQMVEKAPSIEASQVDKYRLDRQPRSTVVKAQNLLLSLGYQVAISDKNSCNPKNSFVIFDNNKVKGVIINTFHDNNIYVNYITGSDPKTVFKLISLLCFSLTYDKISPDNIVFLALNDKSLGLIEHLYPDTPVNTSLSVYDAVFYY